MMFSDLDLSGHKTMYERCREAVMIGHVSAHVKRLREIDEKERENNRELSEIWARK